MFLFVVGLLMIIYYGSLYSVVLFLSVFSCDDLICLIVFIMCDCSVLVLVCCVGCVDVIVWLVWVCIMVFICLVVCWVRMCLMIYMISVNSNSVVSIIVI